MNDKVRNFEDLAVFQKARSLVKDVYRLTRNGGFSRDSGLTDQIRRAAISVVSNIAEGFERGGNTELIQFLYIAKGSCGEVRAQLMIAHDEGYIDFAAHARLTGECRRLGAGLANLIAYLRESKYRGAKDPHRRKAVSPEFQALLDNFVPPPAVSSKPETPNPLNP